MTTIRRAAAGDEPILAAMLAHAAHLDAVGDDVYADPALACYVEGWGREGDLGCIAEDGDRPIGAAWLRLLGTASGYSQTDAATPELAIAVEPGSVGEGGGDRAALLRARIVGPTLRLDGPQRAGGKPRPCVSTAASASRRSAR